jgi:hypothetical protein
MRFVRTPLESRALLAAASVLVPRPLKAEWRREWDGEVWWWASTQPGAGRAPRERMALAIHCCGAIADALYLRSEDAAPIAAFRLLWLRPSSCLAGLVLLLAFIGAASGGFQHTRRALAFYRDPGSLAVLSQTGPFMGQRLGVPPLKVVYWDRHALTMEGAAIYSWYRSAVGDDSDHTEDRSAAKVGPGFFTLLNVTPQIGRVFATDDLVFCPNCVVLGYDFWKRKLGADPTIVGRTIAVDGHPARIIGVLRKEFWFLGADPAVWSLFDPDRTWRGFPNVITGAIGRLKPGVAPPAAERELRALAREVLPRASGAWVNVTPLDIIVGRPIATLGPAWLTFVCIAGIGALVVGQRKFRRSVFLFSKAVLALTVVLVVTIEFGGAASVTKTGGITFAAGAASLWLFLAGSGFVARWCWRDQCKRCPTCLSLLAMPVRIGEGARLLLEQSGTELACPLGHGTLFTSEGASSAPAYRWTSLDVSWRDLFVSAAKT